MKDYMPRVVDAELAERLAYAGAVVVRGPKWCGKTETARRQAASELLMQDPDQRASNLQLAEVKPSLLLRGDKPRLLDEWQEAPQLWDAVRYAVDANGEPGQFLLTGSATPNAQPQHSGAGRMSFLEMRPMSLFESRESSGEVSLRALFDGEMQIAGCSQTDVEALSFLTCRGGWPRAVTTLAEAASLEMAFDYLAVIAEEDISRTDGVQRNPRSARAIMQEYARCTATAVSMNRMRSNLKNRGTEMSKDTVNSYVAALRRLYVFEDLPAWRPSLRARSRVSATPTRHFCDPSIAVAALGASPQLLLRDMPTFGLLFESLCVRDLRVYAQVSKGEVMHYHDSTGLEADAVVALRDGRYGLVEVKMPQSLIDEGAASLLAIADKLDQDVMGAPSFMMVLTAGQYAYQRPDGVFVVPIACLAP